MVDMLKTCDLLVLRKAEGGHYTVDLASGDMPSSRLPCNWEMRLNPSD